MQIYNGEVIRNDVNGAAMGGTEMMTLGLAQRIDPELIKEFQIVVSRLRGDLDPDKIRIFWAHDLPGDPESAHLANEGWKRYHHLVFVSHWQMQAYINNYDIPWSRCLVMRNAITPLTRAIPHAANEPVRLIYHSTPHRGLDVLSRAFDRISADQDIELDVYSSYQLYGWAKRDEEFKPLFDALRANPKVRVHPTLGNAQVCEAVSRAHVFAYPSTWPETSCLCLMEAMSAGLACVHSSLGALPETGANWTMQYQYQDNFDDHVEVHIAALAAAIEGVRSGRMETRFDSQKSYADFFYGWNNRSLEWHAFLQAALSANPDRRIPEVEEKYTYSTG